MPEAEELSTVPLPKIIVVIPTYNESENIARLARASLDLDLPNLHALFVDDNSPDGTGRIADELAASSEYDGRVFALHRPQKQGLGPACIDGFKRALALGAELVIEMDADFSHQPKYIPQLLELVEDCDMVMGSRYARGGSVDDSWGPLRKLLSWWANRVYIPAILRMPVKDATGGFRVYRRECLIGIDLDNIKANGYVFQVEKVYVAQKLGFKIAETPIHFPDRQRGSSKMSASVAAEAALAVWQILRRHRNLEPGDCRLEPYSSPA